MGIGDLAGKAKEFLEGHDEQVDQGLEKAGEFAKGKFAGHDEQIDGAIDKAQAATGGGDTTEGATQEPTPDSEPNMAEGAPPPGQQ